MLAGIPARAALTLLFAVDGTIFASWASRLPQVQVAVGVGEGGLGLALIGTAVGAFAAMPLVGWWCRAHDPAPVALIAALLMCAAVALPGLANSPGTLLGLLVAFGLAYGAVDVAMNSAAVQIAERLARPMLPSFHAAFSTGNVLGAVTGAVMAAHAVPVETNLLYVGATCTLLLAVCAPSLWRSGSHHAVLLRAPSPKIGGRVFRGRLRWVLAAASLTFATAFGEGAVANWSGIHLQQTTAATAGTAPLGYAAFALAEVLGRVAGTRVTERWGPRKITRASTVLAVLGLLVALTPHLAAAAGGYFLAGLGMSCLFPLGIARAGQLADSAGVTVASILGYGGFLLGPPIIGALAAASSLSVALLAPVLLISVCLASSGTLPTHVVSSPTHSDSALDSRGDSQRNPGVRE